MGIATLSKSRYFIQRKPACVGDFISVNQYIRGLCNSTKTQHDGGGKWPGLRGVVTHVLGRHGNPNFLVDLAGDRFFQTFARLNEAGQDGMAAGRPVGLAPDDAALTAIVDQHDNGRVRTREMNITAGRIAATPQVASVLGDRRTAAAAAVTVAPVPEQQCPGIGQM